MNLSVKAAVLVSSFALVAFPAMAEAGHGTGEAGQHGNHCGRGHAKHVKGQGGLKLGKTCVKGSRSHGQAGNANSVRDANALGTSGASPGDQSVGGGDAADGTEAPESIEPAENESADAAESADTETSNPTGQATKAKTED